jgi:hypothetical protein
LREDGGVLTYYVLRQGDPTLGEPELAGYVPAEQALSRQVAALTAPNGADGGDPGQVLGEFGIRWVVLPSPVDEALAQRLDAAVGIVPVSSAPAYDLWQVAGPVARVRVLGPGGTVSVLQSDAIAASAIHAPPAGGTLVLAEPAGGWKATLNGRALTTLAKPFDGWAQAFTLPAGGGRLVVTRDNMARDLSLFAELIVFLAVCALALPGKRAEPGAEAAAPAALQAARRGKQAGGSDRAEEPESQAAEDVVPVSVSRRPGHSLSKGRGQRGKGAELPNRVPGRRVASSPGVAAVTESDSTAESRVGVLDDSGNDAFPGAASVAKAGTGAWVNTPLASAGSSRGSGRTDGASRSGSISHSGGNGRTGNTGSVANTGSAGRADSTSAPWEASVRSDAGAGETDRSGAEAGEADWGTGAGEAGWGTDADERQSGEPDRRAGRDNRADWAAVLAERDSGGWPTVSGGRPIGAPLTTEAMDAWRSDSGSNPGSGWDTGARRNTGPNETWRSDSGAQPADRATGRTTGSQPWEPLPVTPREAFEPAGDGRPGTPGRPGTAPHPAATRSAEDSAREAKPAERHSHRAPGRHGRPARRIWDRAGKDAGKDKDRDE